MMEIFVNGSPHELQLFRDLLRDAMDPDCLYSVITSSQLNLITGKALDYQDRISFEDLRDRRSLMSDRLMRALNDQDAII